MKMTLQQTLGSLCHKTGWCYAVFWKLQCRGRMMLTWEDGYYKFAKSPAILSSALMMPNSLLNGLETGQDACSLEDQIGLAVAKMSYQVFSLGEGIIGHVAFTGKHQWVLGENNSPNSINSCGGPNGRSVLEYPAGWTKQFAAGIKTIAIVAVVPHGVVQLGSTHVIMEDLELVRHIKTSLVTLQNVPEAFPSDRVQEYGKIKGSFLPAMSMPPISLGNPPTIRETPMISLRDQSIQPLPKQTSSSFLRKSGVSLATTGASSLKDKPCLVSSMCGSDASAEVLGHPPQFQINSMQLNSFSFQENKKLGVQMEGRVIVPPGASNYSMTLMEQQVLNNMRLQQKLHASLANGQTSVQPLLRSSMTSGFQEAAVLSSSFGKVESKHKEKLLKSCSTVPNTDDVLMGEASFEAQNPHLGAFKQIAMQPSFPTLQDAIGNSGDSSASLEPLTHINHITRANINLAPVDETVVGNVASMVPTLSSVDIQASVSDSRQSFDALQNSSVEQLDTGLPEVGSNGLISSLGDGFSFSEALGLEQNWLKEMLTKDTHAVFYDSMADKLSYADTGSSKGSEMSFGELPTVRDAYDGDGVDEFNKYFKLMTKGHENNLKQISHLPVHNELFEALGSASPKVQEGDIWEKMLLPKGDGTNMNLRTQSFGVSTDSVCVSEMDANQSLNAPIDRSPKVFSLSKSKSKHILEVVVANAQPSVKQRIDNNIANEPTLSRLSSIPSLYSSSVRADSCLAGETSDCEQNQSELVGVSESMENVGKGSLKISTFTSDLQGEVTLKRSPRKFPLKDVQNLWIDEDQGAKCEDLEIAPVKKSEEPVKANMKRARPGERARPRPKDRQQIQDRIRELREIVPDGTKCSIDALLERTIKHMLFLQCVLKHADKLKQNDKTKVLEKEDSLIAKDNLEGGASWALELGGQTIGCPIIVENLNQPRQMLVEMMCKEHRLFVEIADIIRSLELTILKGIMEVRNSKTWACFIVEANRDVHRMEILWSLMHLLQPHATNS